MKKQNIFDLFSKVGGRIFDESAKTRQEIADNRGVSISTIDIEVRRLLAAGKIEKVWKNIDNRATPAYRPKQ